VLAAPGELLFDGIARAQRHCDELPDHAFLYDESIEPGLLRDHDVVLRTAVEPRAPRLAGDRIDLARGDLHRERILRVALRVGPRIEVYPECLALVHRQHHPTTLQPMDRYARLEVVHLPERKPAEAGCSIMATPSEVYQSPSRTSRTSRSTAWSGKSFKSRKSCAKSAGRRRMMRLAPRLRGSR
jgi:hypothetical protein